METKEKYCMMYTSSTVEWEHQGNKREMQKMLNGLESLQYCRISIYDNLQEKIVYMKSYGTVIPYRNDINLK